MYGSETKAMLEDLVIPMKRMGLKVGELMTLRMIMFWNPGDVGLTLSGVEISRTVSVCLFFSGFDCHNFSKKKHMYLF